MKIIIRVFMVLFLNISLAQECNLSISGKVYDLHDGIGVPYAKVQIKDFQLGAICDSIGNFQIQQLCPQKYTLVFSHHIGCEPVKLEIDLKKDTILQTVLEFHLLEYEGIDVVDYKVDKNSSVQLKFSLSQNALMSGNTLGKQLEVIPGIRSLNTGNSISKPIIHGLHSNRVLIVNNGVKQEGQQWGSEHAPEIDPNYSSEVTLVKGASTVQFGSEAIAGVIVLEPDKIDTAVPLKIRYNGSYGSNGNVFGNSLLIVHSSRKFKGVYARIQGTQRIGGNNKTPKYYLDNTGFKELNFAVNAGYERNKILMDVYYSQFNTSLGIFSGSHISNLTDLQNAYNASEPYNVSSFSYKIKNPRQEISHQTLRLKGKYNFTKKTNLALVVGRQVNERAEFDIHKAYSDSVFDANKPAFRLQLVTNSGELILEHKINEHVNTKMGVTGSYQGNAYAGRYFVPNFIRKNIGSFAIVQYDWKTWAIEAGIRGDYSNLHVYKYENKILTEPIYNFQNISYSLGLVKEFSHHFLVKLNGGKAWRPPSINELYSKGLHHGSASIENGRVDLKKEESYAIQTNFEYKSKKIQTYLDVYYNQFSNFIYLRPSLENVLTIQGAFPQYNYEQTALNMGGFDWQLDYKPFESLSVTSKYAVVRAENFQNKTFIVGIPADRLSLGFLYTKKFKKIQMNIGAESLYTFEQKRVEFESDFVAPPKAYSLINMNVGIKTMNKNPIEIVLVCNNLLNTTYRDYLNRYRYFADDLGINFGIKLKIELK